MLNTRNPLHSGSGGSQGPESEAIRGVKMEITVSNLVREIQTKGLEAMTPKLEKALSEWESARAKDHGSVKKTKDFGRQ